MARSSSKALWLWIVPVAVLAAGIFYYVADPQTNILMPKCPIKTLTGYQCASCGGQRALHAFLHGNIKEAFSYNWFFVVAIPFFLLTAYSIVMIKRPHPSSVTVRLYAFATNRYTLYSYVAIYLIWWVVRNIIGC